ncbi:MAG: type II toxin-antitoxin system RelE/ParE family toxin [Bryobacterales bacterium]|nr:type II toxin-antitoxin system RelE/ParE family toxin [Bryobacterales bacterium]
MRIRWTVRAAEDLERINDYLEMHSPHFAEPAIRKIYEGVCFRKAWPDRGRHGRRRGARELVPHRCPTSSYTGLR